ncbi:MAG: hypothetical protein LBR42_04415 [Candidatus Methanoplasma sp.]|jgi:hypothetical protein|nr:hypothetical protein [Candidatus Methanoplasma sp.]
MIEGSYKDAEGVKELTPEDIDAIMQAPLIDIILTWMKAGGRTGLSISELTEQLSGIRIELEEIKDEEENKYDNLPEAFQNGEKGEQFQEAINALEEAVSSLDDAESTLGGLV